MDILISVELEHIQHQTNWDQRGSNDEKHHEGELWILR